MGRRGWAAIAVVVVVMIVAATVGYILTRPSLEAPDPTIPTLDYYATDLAGALSEDDVYYINQLCYEVDLNSSCEMAVVVVNTTYPHDIEYFALRTFQHNGIGKAGSDNGVLVVVATNERAWRIEVGYGLEGVLTDVRVDRLAREFLEPNMTEGGYGDGLFELTFAMGIILESEYVEDHSSGPAFPVGGVPLTAGQWAIVIVVLVVLTVLTRGMVIRPFLWVLLLLSGGRGGFGGGRSGGGGASGRP